MSEPNGEYAKGNEYQLNGNMRYAHDTGYVGEKNRSVQRCHEKSH